MTASSVRPKGKKENLFRVSPSRYMRQKPPKKIKLKAFTLFHLVKLQLRNHFIHVGVDISSYALLIGGRSSYPPLCWLSYSTRVQYIGISV